MSEHDDPWKGWPVDTPKRLWVTFGNSPQPAVLAVLALKPDEIVPIVTEQSTEVADIAKAWLKSLKAPSVKWLSNVEVTVDDPSSILSALQTDQNRGPAHLVYNGGTTAMSATATATEALLRSEGHESCRLWNVADRSGEVRSSDGHSVPIPRADADLKTHLELTARTGEAMTLKNFRQEVTIRKNGAAEERSGPNASWSKLSDPIVKNGAAEERSDPFPFKDAKDVRAVAEPVKKKSAAKKGSKDVRAVAEAVAAVQAKDEMTKTLGEDVWDVAAAVAAVLRGKNPGDDFKKFLQRHDDEPRATKELREAPEEQKKTSAENKLKAREAQEICGKAIEWGVFVLIARGLRAAYDKRRQLVVDAHVYLGANIQRGAELAIELDVVVVHGPRLTVISCGSSPRRGELTLKYSEAIQRAEVVGGGEARSITVVQRTGESRAESWGAVVAQANKHRKVAYTDAHPQADRHRLVCLAELFGVDPASRTLVVDVMKAFKDPLNTLDSSKSTKDFSQLSLGRDASLFSGLLYP